MSGEPPCTLEEVGQAFGVTRERIRQIENNTLKKLESLPEAQAIEGLHLRRGLTGEPWVSPCLNTLKKLESLPEAQGLKDCI